MFMPKIAKMLLILFFIAIGLFSLFFSFMIVGAGVSGSGCGTVCLNSVSDMKIISYTSFGLALLSVLLPTKKRNNK